MRSQEDAVDLSVTGKDFDARVRKLRIWNIAVGVVLAVQAVVIAVLASDFSIPVVATYMEGPPGTDPTLTKIGSFPLA